jgi:hypothetical protein
VNLHCTRTGRGSKRRAGPYRRRATRRARRLGQEAAARRRLFWGRGRAPDDWAARQRPFWGRGGCPVAGVVGGDRSGQGDGSRQLLRRKQVGAVKWDKMVLQGDLGERFATFFFRVILFSVSFKNGFAGDFSGQHCALPNHH